MDKKNIIIGVLVVVTIASLICTIVLATNSNKDDYNIAYVNIGDSWSYVAIKDYTIKNGVVELTDAVYRVKMKLSMDNCILMKDDDLYFTLTH